MPGWYDIHAWFWCPEDGIRRRSQQDGVPYEDWVRDGYLIATPGDVTDYDFVEAKVMEIAEVRAVGEIGYDKWNATQLATHLAQDGAAMVAISQTHQGLGPAWRELEKALAAGRIRHGNNPVLRWMAGNVQVETDPAGNYKPSKRVSSERIDGMVALDMGFGQWIANGGAPAIFSAA